MVRWGILVRGNGRVRVLTIGRHTGFALTLIAACISPAHAFETLDFNVAGDDTGIEDAVRGASLLIGKKSEGVTDPQDILAAARAEYGRIIGALYAEGHYSPVVSVKVDGREASSIPPLEAPSAINRIEVTVTPGPEFAFSTARIAPLAQGTELPEGFATGKTARSGVIQESAGVAVDAWRSAGHAKAAPSGQSIVADHARQTLAADVTLRPGPKLRFGPLTLIGQQRMRERRIRAIAGYPEGEVFDPEAIKTSADRLRRTGVFRSVSLTEDDGIISPDLQGVTATLVEEKRRRYSFGAEIGSSEGAKLSGYWLHRNLFGGAERLRIDGEVANIGAQNSGIDYSLGATLERPATFNPDTTLSFRIKLSHLDEQDYVADVADIGVGLSRIFTDKLTGSVGLEYQASNVSDVSGNTQYRLFALPVGVIWDNRDNQLNPTKGFYAQGEAKPFLGFGSTDSGARLTWDGRVYRGLGSGDKPVVLAARVQGGAILGGSLAGVPRDFLFYSGGGGTVRGQPYQSLGVNELVANGETFQTGGTSFLAASVEARVPVTKSIGVVGFVDAGYVGAGTIFSDAGEWHAGAGIGLRYDTGVGPIRLDIAGPVGGNTGEGVQIYVGIGQAF